MDHDKPSGEVATVAREILGYLNFSSGAPDPRFLKNVGELFRLLEGAEGGKPVGPIWRAAANSLQNELLAVRGATEAFRQVDQAEAAIRLVFEAALPAYREFHRDLLFHQTEETLFQPFFVGRMCEAVLQQGSPWEETDRIVRGAIRRLNDYLGHRPVAVLRSEQKLQPYEHEWVRPIPLWIRGAGAAVGPYRELVETALAILDATDPGILLDAMFAMDQLDELAVDPRAYDFDHPVNKRPNYLFGQWDMNHLDNAGRSRRFVLQQVALDAMLERIEQGQLPRRDVLFEEAAVLAGTMLMGSGVSGNRPDAHDSTISLATLLPKIAGYRDAFYEQLLRKLTGPHSERLRAEAVSLRQPLGAARQHFNHCLAARRARQLQHVHLAQLFAALGCEEQAARHAEVVPTASARMTCQMRCHMSAAHLAIERGRLDDAAAQLPPVEDLLHRAIECGAMVDPWNILGFGGQYSLFPAIENSVQDHRVDDLLDMLSDVFMLYVETCQAAAATGKTELQQTLLRNLAGLAHWWDRFASVEVGSVDGVSGQAALESAESVAAALRAWHEGGAAAGDVAFWRRHVEHFTGPKAYALVVEALLDHGDFVAAMALLVQWLSQAEEIPLVEEDFSFHDLAMSWMDDLWRNDAKAATSTPQRWAMARKFLDYLEANAEEYWQTPHFEMAAEVLGMSGQGEELEEEEDEEEEEEFEDEDNLFGAAYEHVTYRDTADDGIEGEMYETGPSSTEFELVGEAERIFSRLGFLGTLAQLWKVAAGGSMALRSDAESHGGPAPAGEATAAHDRDEVLAGWLEQAERNHRQLLDLMDSVHAHRIPSPRGTQESLAEYDRRRSVKETLLEEIIQTSIETADAARSIRASMEAPPPVGDAPAWEKVAGEVLSAMLRGDPAEVRRLWPALLPSFSEEPLLYVSLARGGDPRRIAASRSLQHLLRRLLSSLPRLGLLAESCRLLEVVAEREAAQLRDRRHPIGPGATTEFDVVFEAGCKAIVHCLVVSSAEWGRKKRQKGSAEFSRRADSELVDCLEAAVEVLLRCWLVHSRRVRLSVLESVSDPQQWRSLKQFIESYGGDLFTQQFLSLGNVRGILHQGVPQYLETLREEAESEEPIRLVADLDASIGMDEAAHWLSTALEAVLENYGEYIDYNSITTQSDRGEMLYTLLDFLRLRAHYERLAWNLRPVMLAHQVLVRGGRDGAAEVWRRAVASRTAPMAKEHLERFDRLCKKYGMHLPSIAQRFAERFVRPMEIDQLCALMRPAVEELRNGREATAMQRFEEEIGRFTAQPSGAGYELPGWLDALERELDEVGYEPAEEGPDASDIDIRLPQVRLSREEARKQIDRMIAEGPKLAFDEE
ncbi:MAG: hypothetical protein LLG00_03010 [Planctomycetaceae bacterium]|nr:hypothetical protein [Planctomycetaceae bacterium]